MGGEYVILKKITNKQNSNVVCCITDAYNEPSNGTRR